MSSTISCAVRSSASDRTAPTGRRDLSCVDQTGRGELILGEVLRAALGLKLITRIGDVAIGVGELEGVDAEIGNVPKLTGAGFSDVRNVLAIGCVSKNFSSGVGFGASGPLAAMASRRSRNSAAVAVGNPL